MRPTYYTEKYFKGKEKALNLIFPEKMFQTKECDYF